MVTPDGTLGTWVIIGVEAVQTLVFGYGVWILNKEVNAYKKYWDERRPIVEEQRRRSEELFTRQHAELQALLGPHGDA